jgi:hypothetical protein
LLEGIFGSIAAKAVAAVCATLGLFGGLAVTGVLPIIGNNAADTVAVETLAVVASQDRELEVGGYVEVPSVAGVINQIPEVGGLTEALPNVDGIVSSYNAPDSGLPAIGLVQTLLDTVTGTVEAVLGTLPVVNQVLPGLPVGTGILGSPGQAPASVDLLDSTLASVPATVESVSGPALPVVGDLNDTVGSLPLIGELLAATQGAVFSLLPGLAVVVS